MTQTDYKQHRPNPWWSRCGLAAIQGASSGFMRWLAASWWDGTAPA